MRYTIYYYNVDEDSWTLLHTNLKERAFSVIPVVLDKGIFEPDGKSHLPRLHSCRPVIMLGQLVVFSEKESV
jgi:hypothetical protein